LNKAKKWLSEAKQKPRSEASRRNIKKIIFNAKLRFALFASLRSAIFSLIQVDSELVTFPARVKKNLQF